MNMCNIYTRVLKPILAYLSTIPTHTVSDMENACNISVLMRKLSAVSCRIYVSIL